MMQRPMADLEKLLRAPSARLPMRRATPGEPFAQGRFEDLPWQPRVPHRYHDAQSSEVVVESAPFGRVRVHVASYGPADAPPVLLVHGLMTSSYSWRYLFEQLGDSYRLVAPDLVGAGRSDSAPRRPHSGAALAAFIGELQQALGITGCLAIGNSLGGYLCMRRALAAPSSFERLAVIHAPAFPQPRLVALHVALKVPGVEPVLRRVVRHDPLRRAHRNVRYHDETLSRSRRRTSTAIRSRATPARGPSRATSASR